MANSFVQYSADGVTYAIPFQYISKSHIHVTVDGVAATFTFTSVSTISLDALPATGAIVEVRRVTPNNVAIVDYSDGSILAAADLDLSTLQSLFLSQEAQDAAEGSMHFVSDGTWDAAGRRVAGAADPVNAQDLVTKKWAETGMTSQLAQAKAQAATATGAASTATAAAAAALASQNAAGASQTASKASQDAAAGSASDAAGSASTATQKASAAAGSATAAAGSATAADHSASDAAGYASAAAGSASAASSSATAAGTSAGNAKTSETNASGSAKSANDAMVAAQTAASSVDSKLASKLDKAGGVATGTITAGDPNQTFPTAFGCAESTAGNSKRAQFNLGSGWQIGQDSAGNGTKDFFLYNASLGQTLTVDPANNYATFRAKITAGDTSSPYPVAFVCAESTVGASKWAGLGIGSNWTVGADRDSSGKRDFFLYNNGHPDVPFSVDSVTNVFNFARPPTINSVPVYAVPITNRKACAVSDFGCPTDGVSNARPAIQAAIDAVASYSGGTIVLPPVGLGMDNTLIARNGVKLEGTGAAAPRGYGSSMRSTALFPLNNLNSFITQDNFTDAQHLNPIHSFELLGVGLDGRYREGFSVNYFILLSMINCRIERCMIRDGNGVGLYNRTNSTASWLNWIVHNTFDGCDKNIYYEGTDSFFIGNYIANARSVNLHLNSTGSCKITANQIDNAGFVNGSTSNYNAVGIYIENTAELYKGASYYQMGHEIVGNAFVANPCDIYFPDKGTSYKVPMTIANNKFHDNRGNNSILLTNNLHGMHIVGNTWSSQHNNGTACVSLYGNSGTCSEFFVGPNAFIDCSNLRYNNLPSSTTFVGAQ